MTRIFLHIPCRSAEELSSLTSKHRSSLLGCGWVWPTATSQGKCIALVKGEPRLRAQLARLSPPLPFPTRRAEGGLGRGRSGLSRVCRVLPRQAPRTRSTTRSSGAAGAPATPPATTAPRSGSERTRIPARGRARTREAVREPGATRIRRPVPRRVRVGWLARSSPPACPDGAN